MKKVTLFNLFIATSLCFLALTEVSAQTINSLSKKEQRQGWTLLFNGTNLDGWTSVGKQTQPEKGWTVENGVLTVNKGGPQRGGDIITQNKYSEFELSFEFKLTKAANGGVKYLFANYEKGGWLGNEYQVLDDDFHPDAKAGINGNRKTASLYDVFPPETANKKMKPTGEWNSGSVTVKGSKVTHTLNGKVVLKYDLKSPEYAKAVKEISKFKDAVPLFGTVPDGHILLQDHQDEVSFRNIKIRSLK